MPMPTADWERPGTVCTYETIPVQRKAIRWNGDNLAQVQNFVGYDTSLTGARTEKFQSPLPDWIERFKHEAWMTSWPATTAATLYEEQDETWVPVALGDWIVQFDKGFRRFSDASFGEKFRRVR